MAHCRAAGFGRGLSIHGLDHLRLQGSGPGNTCDRQRDSQAAGLRRGHFGGDEKPARLDLVIRPEEVLDAVKAQLEVGRFH
jgi:hypothetical protein